MGLSFLLFSLIFLIRFVIQLSSAEVDLNSFYDKASVYLTHEMRMKRLDPEGLLECAEFWIYNATTACSGVLCLLIENVSVIRKERIACLRLVLVLGGLALLVICRRCMNPVAFYLWTGAILLLFVMGIITARRLRKS